MSRTIRRKNAWNAKRYFDVSCDCHNGQCDFDSNQKYGCYHYIHEHYRGCTIEQVEAQQKAWFYSDCFKQHGNHVTQYVRWKLRVTNRNKLVKALKRGEEENLILTQSRTLRGEWWYYD